LTEATGPDAAAAPEAAAGLEAVTAPEAPAAPDAADPEVAAVADPEVVVGVAEGRDSAVVMAGVSFDGIGRRYRRSEGESAVGRGMDARRRPSRG
jgi:hypothetical protein